MRIAIALLPALLLPLACGSSNDDTGGQTDAEGDGAVDDSQHGETSGDSGKGDTPADAKTDGTGTDTTPGGDVAPDVPGDTTTPTGLHVEGSKLVDHGATVRLLGVNHSGAEYACVGDYAIYEGPDPATLADAILTWKANAVRLPINEQCWLGINGLDPKYAGDNYRTTMTDYVHTLRAKGLYVIFDLHWASPATSVPKGQLPMADADHAIDFWKSAAAAFKDDPGVVFDIFNEPFIDKGNATTTDPWDCLQHGCAIHATSTGGVSYPAYTSAGTQDLVDAIRSTGATNVIMVAGLAYTNDLTDWLAHKPTDATGNLAASLHLYNFNSCKDATCWGTEYDPVSKSVPVITGEVGENDCGPGFIDGYMTWADARNVSYLGWTWNTWDCSSGPALITDYSGAATAFGAALRDHLKSL